MGVSLMQVVACYSSFTPFKAEYGAGALKPQQEAMMDQSKRSSGTVPATAPTVRARIHHFVDSL